jgi:hypothetical protein
MRETIKYNDKTRNIFFNTLNFEVVTELNVEI